MNWEHSFIERHPVLWKGVNLILDAIVFVCKVSLAMTTIELIKFIFGGTP